MKIILKNNNIDYNNINLKYNSKYNFYNIQYSLPYVLLNGIPLNINFDYLYIKNKLIYVYIKDNKCIELFKNIDIHLNNICKSCLKIYNNSYYIICNNNSNNKLSNNKNININIRKIKYIYNNYIPIINII